MNVKIGIENLELFEWPAAAVIPAPIAYIKVVAVKKLVVEFWPWLVRFGLHWSVPQRAGLHLLG